MAKSQLFIVALLIVAVTSLQVQQQHTDFAKIETGQLMAMQENGDTWHTVALQNTFSNPVVLMQITSYNGGHPVHIRLRNVMESQFDFKMEEWEYLDEWHTDENINFIVAEAGTYNLACGRQLTVGTIDGVMEQWVNVDFTHDFKTMPVVFSLCQTHNGGDAVVTRTKAITTYDFSVKLKEQEGQDGVHPNAETVGYFAIEAGHCDGLTAGQTEEEYNHEWKAVPFGKSFKEAPITFVTILSHNGGNTAAIRMTNLAENSVDVFIEEEQSADDEMNHVKETLGYLTFEAPNVVSVQLQKITCDPPCDDLRTCDELYQDAWDIMAEFDTNGDNQINIGDAVSSDHLELIQNYCDYTNDGSVSVCELYACVAAAENQWRSENRPQCPLVEDSCAPLEDASCPCDGCWSCDDVDAITQSIVQQYDSNEDGWLTLADDIDEEEYNLAIESCDYNGDGVLCAGEIFDCVVQIENEWRAENAPEHGYLYCDGSVWYESCPECTGQWNCDDIEVIVMDIMAYDTDNNGTINVYDDIESEHLELMQGMCDTNFDGQIEPEELCECMVVLENEWRLENCQGVPDLTCNCRSDCEEHPDQCCPGSWNCYDIEAITFEMMEEMDTNWDGAINLGDQITDDHLDILLSECDANGNGDICIVELFDCIVMVENEWRAAQCPNTPPVICTHNPFAAQYGETCECPGMWNCVQINDVARDAFAEIDANQDGQLNAQDNIEYDHLSILLDNCDTDGNDQLDCQEFFDCVVECEKIWREENCPAYPAPYCGPADDQWCIVIDCPGAWECDDIEQVTMDIIAMLDTNVSGSINPEDAIDSEHYNLLIDNCDANDDGNLVYCEIHECVIQIENDWRDDSCYGYGYIDCECEGLCDEGCPGEWSCEILLDNVEFFFEVYNVNGDYDLINQNAEGMDPEHFALLIDNCDVNADGCLSKHELFECEIECENAWRASYCPSECQFDIHCANPYPADTSCPGSWDCAQMELITWDLFTALDTNSDNVMNLGDDIDGDHLQLILDECDANGNGDICKWELYECLQKVENDWRQENCTSYCQSFCPNPFQDSECGCEYCWYCDDIEAITLEVVAYYDSNGDNSINLEDDIQEEHYIILVDECDSNYDGTVDPCEVYECVIQVENDWRAENAQDYGELTCNKPDSIVCNECEGGMTCAELAIVADDFFAALDTNNDNQVDQADYQNMTYEEFDAFYNQCWMFSDDGHYQVCDIYECLVQTENNWRSNVGCEQIYCNTEDYFGEFDCPDCTGSMTCADLYGYTAETGYAMDSQYDINLNYGDNIPEEHLDWLFEFCDEDGDQNVSAHEYFECLRQAENDWRAANLPARCGQNNCPNPYPECDDQGAWDCNDVEQITNETIMYYDTNVDENINLEDDIESEHLALMLDQCDQDFDGNLNQCEIFDCIVATENVWRAENLGPWCALLYCEMPEYYNCVVCEGAWNCEDIYYVTLDYVSANDTNGDGQVNYGDNLDAGHLDFVLSQCDFNQDGNITSCEAFDCMIIAENNWRSEYCPDSEPVSCNQVFDNCDCPGMWTCDDMSDITEDFWMTFNSGLNDDDLINAGDQYMDEGHLNFLLSECDSNQDGSICKAEFYDCLVIVENDWREYNCPEYGYAWCENPYPQEDCECPGMWTCDDIMEISMQWMAELDTDGNQVINPADNIDADHYAGLLDCDLNDDGSLDECEVYECIVNIENEWRQSACPNYGPAQCTRDGCPDDCVGAWGCQDLIINTAETFQYFDTNGDGSINMGDNITDEHLNFMLENCDSIYNDGTICEAELFDCAVMIENQWRLDNCEAGTPPLYCPNPFACYTCPGEWTCDDIVYITEDAFAQLDTDNNNHLTLGDDIETEHLNIIVDICDTDNDEIVSKCEFFDCLVMVENEWRDEYCQENYGYVYCTSPYYDCGCQGAMSCSDIEAAAWEVLSFYDTNGNGAITPSDDVDMEHYEMMRDACDTDFDGNIDFCEIHTCIVEAENEWRAAACENDFPPAVCPQDENCPPSCPGEWNCVDIATITVDFMAQYDTNNDGAVNLGDYIDGDHLDVLVDQCDYNQDGTVSQCEIFDCVVEVENTWRVDACEPGYPQLWCENVFEPCAECPDAWTCSQIADATSTMFAQLDADVNGAIDLADGLEDEHWEVIQSCDSNQDGMINKCEIFDCIVMAENEYRQTYCPGFGLAYCETPFTDCGDCPENIWTCQDIEDITIQEMAYWDTDNSGAISPEDNIDTEHYALIQDQCDFNNDGTITYCEMHQCTENIENEFRAQYPGCQVAYCPCTEVPPCPGAMDCFMIMDNTEDAMTYYDTNNDGTINIGDEITQEHLDLLLDICDGLLEFSDEQNPVYEEQDGNVDKCEVFNCLVLSENHWREEMCPEADKLYCANPYVCPNCYGLWTCDQIEQIASDVFAEFNTNGDNAINLGDNIDQEHLDLMIADCDMNGDGSVNECEVHECIVRVENEWRAETCPDYNQAICECPFYEFDCEYAWSCDDIDQISNDIFVAMNTNGDNQIDIEDTMDADHYAMLVEIMDLNDDGVIELCEVHAYVVEIEVEYRAEYCPGYGEPYCPYECPTCEGSWTCTQIVEVVEEMFDAIDTNYDGQINMGDMIEEEHLNGIIANCDANGNNQVDRYELHDCMVIVENEWRLQNCDEGFPQVYCPNPYPHTVCEGAWYCDDIVMLAEQEFQALDTDNNDVIDTMDNIDEGHLIDIQNMCDFNNDGFVQQCEIEQCYINVENAWRTEYCPEYGYLYCELECPPICEGCWTCDDIEMITMDVINYYSTNNDQAINPEDDMSLEHYDILIETCDTNFDGTVDACEVHACIVTCEEQWRADMNYDIAVDCPCEIPLCPCEGSWNCIELMNVVDEFMSAADSNGDGQINLGDEIGVDHYDMLIESCDLNGDGTICGWEAWECALVAENAWRAEVCPDCEPLFCSNPYNYETCHCEGHWTCDDIVVITEDVFTQLNEDGNDVIDSDDNIDAEHLDLLLAACDSNNNNMLDRHEIFECVVVCENDWRAQVCPEYGMVYCINPYTPVTCEGAWTCDDIHHHALDVIAAYDMNGDGNLNPEDVMNSEHYDLLIANCDFNNDGNISICDMQTCITITENEWRAEYCPMYGDVECEFIECPKPCEGCWYCDDIIYITEDYMMYNDSNNDGNINLGDYMETEHLDILMEMCDSDDNGTVTTAEVFDCVIMVENTWRDEYHPEEEHLYCYNPYPVPVCYNAWSCDDVYEKTQCIMTDYDSNGDSQINLADAIDADHMAILNEECDQDNSGSLNAWEVFDCLVKVENEWRASECPEYGDLYCENPYNDVTCEGSWNCEDVDGITEEVFAYYDTNQTGYLDINDEIDADHFNLLLEECDTDVNGTVEYCELKLCIVQCENAWRQEFCDVEFGTLFCGTFESCNEVCEGEWNCMDILVLMDEISAAFDTNEDGYLNLNDNIEAEHYDLLMAECDEDGNGTIEQCELHACLVRTENDWRLQHCESGYPPLYCQAESWMTCYCECPAAWYCDDIMNITAEFMSAYDTTYDGYVNSLDDIQYEHFTDLAALCDQNGDGSLDAYEVFECVNDYENDWRSENCPCMGDIECENPVPATPECAGVWSCEQVNDAVIAWLTEYDMNGDGYVNADDAQMYPDPAHIEDIVALCDAVDEEDGSLDKCELHDCIVMIENDFREEYCPASYPALICPCEHYDAECPGEWDCYDIQEISIMVINELDSNDDGAINLGDNIASDHLDILMEQCDFNGDGTITNCEIHDCVEMCENNWRMEYCPEGYNMVFCNPTFQCNVCEQAYTCEMIEDAVEAVFAEMDVNQDNSINLGDMDEAHFEQIAVYCDLNDDQTIDKKELHDCMVMYENEWRADNCPGFGDAFCPYDDDCICSSGAWECPEIEAITADCLAYYDTNIDGAINPQDNMDPEHYAILTAECDFNNDGTIEACEVHQCVEMIENAWRDEFCSCYGHVYCNYDCEPVCEGAWNCDDVLYMTEEVMNAMDSNGDGQLNLGDNIDGDHYQVLMFNCDTNGDGDVSSCELFDCLVVTENEWRADYCPDAEPIYCVNPLEPCTVCEGYWTCEDIYGITVAYMELIDTNQDGQINLGDDIDPVHYEWLVQECDFNGDLNICDREIYDCTVMVENEWRAENCPGYGFAYCSNPFPACEECEGAWDCNDIEMITNDVIAYYDTNMDTAINPEDEISEEHYVILLENCDFNNDGTVDACEVQQCVVIVENEWRDEYCPDYGYVYCPCESPICEGAWNCSDVTLITGDFMDQYDTNNDGQVNLGDYVDPEHLDILFEQCDNDGNGSVSACEAFECVVKCENEWRAEYCPEVEPLFCANPYTGCTCEGEWTCEDIFNISNEVIAMYDANGDGNLNLGDVAADEDGTHMYMMLQDCDFDGDSNVTKCEVHECIMMVENDWRAEYCPENYGELYCACPYPEIECPGAWDCDEIELISIEVLNYYETNGDYAINPEDNIEIDHYNLMVEYCDFNNDGTIDTCEVHTCVIMCENEWRAEVCPEYGFVYCDCPFYVVPCEGAWNCLDVAYVTEDIMVELDTNYDGVITVTDNLDQDHLDMLMDYCDLNGDNVLEVCEVHDCVVMCENEWRHEYCEYSEDLYCTCPLAAQEVATCDGAWNCEDIMMISNDILLYYDTNYDGTISLEDEIDPAHLDEINANCDFDNNGVTDACEVHQCIVIIENDWRAEYCPGYPEVYCECPFEVADCEGAWNCEDIANISLEVLNIYDTNYDGSINLQDEIETEHYDLLTEYCDYNNDGTIDSCEVHACIVDCENAWRDEYCPDYGHIYCDCPFYVPTCDGAWNCDDIYNISVEMINAYDTNYDGTINLEDEIDPSHYDILVEYCDTDGNGEVDSCETHACIIQIENEWRDEYCPESEHVYCDCPF